jgi:uncharacterized membrane protein
MTNEQQEPAVVDAAVVAEADDTGATVVGAIGDETGTKAAGAVVTDYDHAVVVAAFADDTAAHVAYEALRAAETGEALHIDGVLVIKTDAESKVHIQKMTDHSTRTGAKWGAVGGLVLGIVFPPAIIASTVGWGAVGGILGKFRQEFHKSEVGEALAGTLGPNQSGILALVRSTDVAAAKQAMPEATKVRTAGVDEETAKGITDAAKKAS